METERKENGEKNIPHSVHLTTIKAKKKKKMKMSIKKVT